MTEFVITLPVYITIFIGMGTIYQLHDAGLKVMGEANRNVWMEAQNIPITAVSPLNAAFSIGNLSDLFVTGVNGLGIYKDSYAKTVLLQVVPGAPGVDPVVHPVEQVGGFGINGHSRRLLDDFYDVSGWNNNSGVTGMITAAMGTLGMSLGAGAGIRYGAGDGEGTPVTINNFWGSHTLDPGKLALPYNTAATHRIVAVGQTRLQHSTDSVFNESILNFDWDLNTNGPPDIGAINNPVNQTPPPPGSCGAQAQNYANCITPLLQGGMDPGDAQDACQNLEPAASCGNMSGTSIPSPGQGNCTQFGIPPQYCNF